MNKVSSLSHTLRQFLRHNGDQGLTVKDDEGSYPSNFDQLVHIDFDGFTGFKWR